MAVSHGRAMNTFNVGQGDIWSISFTKSAMIHRPAPYETTCFAVICSSDSSQEQVQMRYLMSLCSGDGNQPAILFRRIYVQVEERKNLTMMLMLGQNNKKYVVAEIRTANPVFVCTIDACHTRAGACSCGFSYRVHTLFRRRKINVFSWATRLQ